MALHIHESGEDAQRSLHVRPRPINIDADSIPKLRMPARGMLPGAAYEIVHDELLLDGVARLNLATFVTTWMDQEAELLMAECAAKNMIDKDEYPQTAELERRCVNILASLWHAAEGENATGCSTTGSSEACMLGGLALLRRWRARPGHEKTATPNLVMGANVQVCWEKFCRYWDVEARLVPVSAEHTHLTAETALAHCDENTIGVVAVLGSTFDGAYEPVAQIAAALDALAEGGGPDVPIHVDGASGGMVAPFIDPDLEWDFRIKRVQSINTSGHKYGLVYPGVGWVVWRERGALPDELVFSVDYLGGHMPTFSLNFSRPGAQVVAQYYMFLRLGFEGYRDTQQTSRDTAIWLAEQIGALDCFELVSRGDELPVFAFSCAVGTPFTVYDVSDAIRSRGWLVPAYKMPAAIDDISVLRIVVRNGFTRDLAELFLDDLQRAVRTVARRGSDPEPVTSFHH